VYPIRIFAEKIINNNMSQNIQITLSPALRLAQALKHAGVENPATITRLTLNGTLTGDDFKYIRENMRETLQELDMSGALVENSIIENRAFHLCTGLTSVTIPALPVEIEEMAFSGCVSLKSVIIPATAGKIGKIDIYYPISVHPDNPFFTGEDGILFNKDKTEIIRRLPQFSKSDYTLPASVAVIGNRAFAGCRKLASVSIPDTVVSIGENAFAGCCGLTSVNIPPSVKKIGRSAFCGCDRLTSIYIPASVTEIKDGAFELCFGVTSIAVHPDNPAYTDINGVLFDKDKTRLIQFPIRRNEKNYVIPDTVTTVGYGAFTHCRNLTSVTVPASVTAIGDCAFDFCSNLKSVTIPASVTKIGGNAFYGCNSLSVTVPASVTEIGADAFGNFTAKRNSGIRPLRNVNENTFVTVHPDNPVFTSENGKLKKK
jgi:hypothetical protein